MLMITIKRMRRRRRRRRRRVSGRVVSRNRTYP
jgi:hypothetical protein